MKNKFYFLLCALLPLSAFSQPAINLANMPQTGDQVMISICSDPIAPGNSGEMQTWDMGGLTEQEEQSFTYIDPATAPRIDSFPDANLVAQNWSGDYSFYQVSASGLKILGHVASIPPDDTSLVISDQAEQLLELPYTYNHSHTSTFTGSSWVPGFGEFPFDGSLNFEADGYGTLILPNGTYENVVRYHFYREQVNYINGIPSTTQTKEQWAWVSAEYRFWLLLMEENFDGFNTTSLVWYDKNPYPASPAGISESVSKHFEMYPNPVKSGNNLHIEWESGENVEVTLIAVNGQIVEQHSHVFQPGINTVRLKTTRPGLYTLIIRNQENVFSHRIYILK